MEDLLGVESFLTKLAIVLLQTRLLVIGPSLLRYDNCMLLSVNKARCIQTSFSGIKKSEPTIFL